jgi:hypothetical protein
MSDAIKNKRLLLPFEIITDKELIPTFKESILKDGSQDSIINYLIIIMFFNLNYPSITCSYFDYKIADLASTTAFPLLTGYIPSSNLIDYFLEQELVNDMIYEELRIFDIEDKDALIEEFKRRIKIHNKTDFKFVNFVENCEPKRDLVDNFDEIEFHKQYGIFQEEKSLENDIINDCPKPFYKQMRLFGNLPRKRRTSKAKIRRTRKKRIPRRSKKRS